MAEWSKDELTKLRSNLPDTWKKDIAAQFNLSQGTVKNILYGTQEGEKVIIAAIELAGKYKPLKEKLITQAKEALAQL